MDTQSTDHDSPEAIAARASQTDPLVMYLIVRRSVVASADELVAAAAQATVRCATGPLSTDDRFAADFAVWFAASYRKVTLRASEGEWAKLTTGFAGDFGPSLGEPLVMALPPRRRSEREPLLARLQVFNVAAEALRDDAQGPEIGALDMVLVPNPGVVMSVGKAMAQAGHGALMAAAKQRDGVGEWPVSFEDWAAAGWPISVEHRDEQTFHDLAARTGVSVVRDAGLTEVEPGSQTFLAIPPGLIA
jgi:peptidyl-tRNA hydrolase